MLYRQLLGTLRVHWTFDENLWAALCSSRAFASKMRNLAERHLLDQISSVRRRGAKGAIVPTEILHPPIELHVNVHHHQIGWLQKIT